MKGIYTTLLVTFITLGTQAQQTVGLFQQDTTSESGYVLFGPMFGKTTHLMDKCGKEIHSWTSTTLPGLSAYLLPDGSLLRPGNAANTTFTYAGAGGIIERQSWTETPVWNYRISSSTECQHHDLCYMPNGNVLAIVWELHSPADARSVGRDSASIGPSVWSEKIVELSPVNASNYVIVWEWRVWDHLVQDRNPDLPGYDMPALHPELIDINYTGHGTPKSPDWLHANTVTYNPVLDQIMISSYYFDEIWIIDHSTTRAEANGHTGGHRHKGGDLIYRWGNPAAYGRGNSSDHQLFAQHDPQWIPAGYPDSGKILIYNNGAGRPEGNFSTVDVITPPTDDSGNYTIFGFDPYGPLKTNWEYKAPNPTDFFSPTISGAQRLSSGNTLITEGVAGELFEVDPAGRTVWRYVSPLVSTGPVAQGTIASQNSVFRARQYRADYPGLAGRTLTPGVPIEISPIAYNCYFKSTIITPNGVQGIAGQGSPEVVNPIAGNEIRLRPSQEVSGAQIVLLNALGQRCGAWTTDLHKGAWMSLPLQGSGMAGGHYTLHVTAQNGERSSIAVVK